MSPPQSAMQKYFAIMKYHGPIDGCRRVLDQLLQIDLYDALHSTNTGQILSGKDFWAPLGAAGEAAATMHYQPTYTASVGRPLKYLAANFPVVGASSTCFLDLGCGRAKALHVARSVLQHVSLVGIDLHPGLLEDAARNLGVAALPDKPFDEARQVHSYCAEPKVKLYLGNVNAAGYDAILAPFDVVLVFNKNSFDKATTERTLELIRKSTVGKSVFYIYNNPVFETAFESFPCVFRMSGWHKNWNTRVYRIR